MSALLVAVLLVSSFAGVHLTSRSRVLRSKRPLHVDRGLPFPAAGQGSSIFSLTALFGAYLAIFLLLRIPALVGLASGSILGLLLIRRQSSETRERTFEGFVAERFGKQRSMNSLLIFLSATQLGYATSELLILGELARFAFGFHPDQAIVLVVAVSIVGYLYVLVGGYDGVYRTDIVQFGLVLLMASALLVSALSSAQPDWPGLLAEPGYWALPFEAHRSLNACYHAGIGLVMGLGFVLASPDTWKRVFVVTKHSRRPRRSFGLVVLSGLLPFALLLPLALQAPPVETGAVSPEVLFGAITASDALYVTVLLGLLASFLSTYDSAILTSVHLQLIRNRITEGRPNQRSLFYWLMGSALIVTTLSFSGLDGLGNPYLLANLLMGPIALVGGLLFGSGGHPGRLPGARLTWFLLFGSVLWFAAVASIPDVFLAPSTAQVQTVPGGVGAFVLAAILARAGRKRGVAD